MGVLYINSTLGPALQASPAGDFSPIHYWGFKPGPDDLRFIHRRSRWAILARYYAGGLDLGILSGVGLKLLAGWRDIYLVTQPDLIQAAPLLCRVFRGTRLVTWVWIPEEVSRWRKALRHCHHVFCLTDGALAEMQRCLPQVNASLQLWGTDPGLYDFPPEPTRYDVALVGVANRDTALAEDALRKSSFSAAVSQRASQKIAVRERVTVIDIGSPGALVACLHRSRAAWIPLHGHDEYPTGYTNLIEALLCGCPTVIAASSPLPRRVLNLPGVYKYEPGSVDSLLAQTEAATAEGGDPNRRSAIRKAASAILDGEALRKSIGQIFQGVA